MNAWENFSNPNQQTMYRPEYFGAGSDYYKGDNMLPDSFNECFYETKATEDLKKWIKVFKISCIVLFVIWIILCFVASYNSSQMVVQEGTAWSDPVTKFSMGLFVLYLFIYAVITFIMVLSYKLFCAVLNCIAQNTRNTGISAKLAAFNTRNQMMKDASKDKDNQAQN